MKDRLNDMHRDRDANRSYNRVTIIALCFVFIGAIGCAWYFYNSSQDKTEGEMLVISADNDEIKVKPSDPGGMVVDNMDKVVYDTIDGQSKVEKVEKILPPAEEPIDKSSLIVEIKPVEVVNVENNLTAEAPTVIEEVAVVEEEYIKPVAKKEASKKASKFIKKDEKLYKVQIASFRSKADVEKEWSNLSRRFPKLVGKYNRYIVTKNIEGKGIFHRLHIGPFNNESEASMACKSLKDSGVNCFIVKP